MISPAHPVSLILSVEEQDAVIQLRDEPQDGALCATVCVWRKGAVLRRAPLATLEELHLYGRVDLLRPVLNTLLAAGVDIRWFSLAGRYQGMIESVYSRAFLRHHGQYRLLNDPARRLQLAVDVVTGKLENQRGLLLLRQRHLRSPEIAAALARMRAMQMTLAEAQTLDAVRGAEGMGAAIYFSAFPHLLSNPAFAWGGRTRRPPRDPINACLSFGYAMLLVQVEQALYMAGVDPFVGALHTAERGAADLALDLTEEFRPLVDRIVLTLINRRELAPVDFVPAGAGGDMDENGAVIEGATWMGDTGRPVFFRAWEQELDRRLYQDTGATPPTVRGLIRYQAHQLRRLFAGEIARYVPAVLSPM